MHTRRISMSLLTTAAALLLALPASAEVVKVLNFDAVPPNVVCDEVWVEEQVAMYFTETTADDCDGGGSCFFGVGPSLWLYPARLVLDFGEPYLVYRIEIDVIDYCGLGCTRAFASLLGATAGHDVNDLVGEEDMLVIDFGTAGAMIDALAISSCEAELLGTSIRIYSETVGADEGTWGRIKKSYR